MAYQRHHQQCPIDAMEGMFPRQKTKAQGPPYSKVIAVVTLVPFTRFLLLLSNLTLAAAFISLTVSTTLLFMIRNPVLVLEAIDIGWAMIGFLATRAFDIIEIFSLSCRGRLLEQLKHAK